MENKELVVSVNNSPAEMMKSCLASGATVEQIGKMIEHQERWESNEAKKSYSEDFSTAQSKILAVVKTEVNPQTRSKYASLESVIEKSKPIYSQYGFSVVFYEGESTNPELIRVCADVMHRKGHSKTYHYDVPWDGVGLKGNANMTKIHAKASSISYGRRYLMCMIWNIPTTDADGNIPKGETINEEEKNAILDNLLDLDIPESKFLEYMKVEKLEDILKSDLKKAYSAFEQKRKK